MHFASYARNVSFFVIGFVGGWQLDLTCVVSGPSMMPTLAPGDRLLQLPYQWWSLCQRRLRGGGGGCEDDLLTRIVVARVSEDISVCKRVTRLTHDANEALRWHMEALQRPVSPLYVEDLDAYPSHDDGEELEASSNNPSTVFAPATSSAGSNPGDYHHSEQEAVAWEDSTRTATSLPSNEWDWCIHSHQQSTKQWLWLEGDNASDSLDSRQAGAIPVECLRAVIVGRWWPVTKLTTF